MGTRFWGIRAKDERMFECVFLHGFIFQLSRFANPLSVANSSVFRFLFLASQLQTWFVGIEFGRAGVQVEGYHSPFRYATWVHSSTLATFPEAPDNPGRPNFSPGLEPWPILHEPSQTPRGLSADSHTPHDSGLLTPRFISVVDLSRHCVRTSRG